MTYYIAKEEGERVFFSEREYDYRKDAQQQANAINDELAAMGVEAFCYVLDELEMMALTAGRRVRKQGDQQ